MGKRRTWTIKWYNKFILWLILPKWVYKMLIVENNEVFIISSKQERGE